LGRREKKDSAAPRPEDKNVPVRPGPRGTAREV